MSARSEQPEAAGRAVLVDAFPRDPRVLARLSPEERAAIYLNSIRKMFRIMLVVIAIGIVAAAVFAVVTIETIDSVGDGTCTNCVQPQ